MKVVGSASNLYCFFFRFSNIGKKLSLYISLGSLDILTPKYFRLYVAILKGRLSIKWVNIVSHCQKYTFLTVYWITWEFSECFQFSKSGIDYSWLRRYRIMSSAQREIWRSIRPKFGDNIKGFFLMARASGSTPTAQSNGKRGQPCRVPLYYKNIIIKMNRWWVTVESEATQISPSASLSLDDGFSASCSPAQVGESPFLGLAFFISLLDNGKQTSQRK